MSAPRDRAGAGRSAGSWRRHLPIYAAVVLVGLLALPPAPTADPAALAHPGTGPGPAASAASDWTTFQGSENRSGYTPSDGPANSALAAELAPSGQPNPIDTGAVANASVVYFSDTFGNVFAYNTTGNRSRLWNTSVSFDPGTPDLVGDRLVVADHSGYVSDLAASTGTKEWVVRLDGAVPEGVSVVGSTIYAGTNTTVNGTPGGTLWALSALTGASEWRASLGAPAAGALAIEGSTIVATTTAGDVVAVSTSGQPLWNVSFGSGFRSAPAIYGGLVAVATVVGNVSVLDLSNGTRLWSYDERTLQSGDQIAATPAIGLGRVFVSTYVGWMIALDLANGTVDWTRNSSENVGYEARASPVVTPRGVYFVDQYEQLLDLSPTNGSTLWLAGLGFEATFGSPAIESGYLYLGTALGVMFVFGPPGGPVRYAVTGTVVATNGSGLVGATVAAGDRTNATTAGGAFSLALPNGTYVLTAVQPGFITQNVTIVVAGPVAGVLVPMAPVPVVAITGIVLDAFSGAPLPNATINVQGDFGTLSFGVTDARGAFRVVAPAGLDYFSVGTPAAYDGFSERITVPTTGVAGLVVYLHPSDTTPDETSVGLSILLPLAALASAGVAIGAWEATRRRVAQGLSGTLLGPFGRFVAMRAILIPVQLLAILFVLYVFGTVLPALAQNINPCTFVENGCLDGFWSWSDPAQSAHAILWGFGRFAWGLVTLNWGQASFGKLAEPATQFMAWWLPDSLELAFVALPISAVAAYYIGLYAGARQESAVDTGARVASIGGLLIPSFLIVLLFLGFVYVPFSNAFGDSPYGLLPSQAWFTAHGGYPTWVGIADNTTPTGFPVLDGILHGDWAFVEVVLVKILWQALAIALVYVAIFLRYARHAVAEAHREAHVVAARARGIDDSTILHRHTGRRVLPLLLLIIGLTLPIYLGTQALVEALANDTGVGTLLLAEMTHVGQSGFGFSATSATQRPANFYQVTIFMLVVLVLLGNLGFDILARYLDPRLARSGK